MTGMHILRRDRFGGLVREYSQVDYAGTGADTGVPARLNVVISMYLADAKAANWPPSAASRW